MIDKRANMDNHAPEIELIDGSVDEGLVDHNSRIIIKQFKSGDEEKWDRFVFSSPDATFFHRASWKSIIETAFGHRAYYLYAEEGGNINGILPLVHLRSLLFGNGLISLPFCAYGGIVAQSEKVKIALGEKAVSLAERLKVGYMEMRNIFPQHDSWPQKELYVTFRKEIDPDLDSNLSSIPRKQRAMVRKGIKTGLKGEIDQSIERFYDAYSQSVRNLGTPVFSVKYFALLKERFGEDCEVLTITNAGRTVSSVMSFYFRDEVLPYYGGGTAESRAVKGNDYMYWELMRRCCEKGIRIFDFGRSKIGTGSYNFKKHWGFEPQPIHYEYYMVSAEEVPNISPLNPKYRLFIEGWKRMPLPLTRLLGPMVARNLG